MEPNIAIEAHIAAVDHHRRVKGYAVSIRADWNNLTYATALLDATLEEAHIHALLRVPLLLSDNDHGAELKIYDASGPLYRQASQPELRNALHHDLWETVDEKLAPFTTTIIYDGPGCQIYQWLLRAATRSAQRFIEKAPVKL